MKLEIVESVNTTKRDYRCGASSKEKSSRTDAPSFRMTVMAISYLSARLRECTAKDVTGGRSFTTQQTTVKGSKEFVVQDDKERLPPYVPQKGGTLLGDSR